jgi:hypothetical protein
MHATSTAPPVLRHTPLRADVRCRYDRDRGVLVLVRPNQFVSTVLPLGAHHALFACLARSQCCVGGAANSGAEKDKALAQDGRKKQTRYIL